MLLADTPFRRVGIWLAASFLVAVVGAGFAAVARGRTSVASAHRASSLWLWSILGAAVLSAHGYAWWVASARPADLAELWAVPAARGPWMQLGGSARGARATFLYDARSGRFSASLDDRLARPRLRSGRADGSLDSIRASGGTSRRLDLAPRRGWREAGALADSPANVPRALPAVGRRVASGDARRGNPLHPRLGHCSPAGLGSGPGRPSSGGPRALPGSRSVSPLSLGHLGDRRPRARHHRPKPRRDRKSLGIDRPEVFRCRRNRVAPRRHRRARPTQAPLRRSHRSASGDSVRYVE